MFHTDTARANRLALFCKVVDNYGDIGICWRLSRQLLQEHGIAVTLWVDDLRSFRRICPQVALDVDMQDVGGVCVRHWRTQAGAFSAADVADIVIEFFACDIPPGYIDAMAQCDPRPVWFNLEGLSAEEWVEGCHALPSMHSRLPLTKYFFFPGFTEKTGGLIHERHLEQQRRQFQSNPQAAAEFFAQLGASPQEIASLKVSLFCYPHAPVSDLFEAWQNAADMIACLIPEGVAQDAVRAFFGASPKPGEVRIRGNLTVRILPFLPQHDYDRLLWSCDLNFVRGEDSFVRAQWAEKPFIWHIYPQDKNLHHVKLKAFLQRYCADIASLSKFSLRWNDAMPNGENWTALWRELQSDFPQIARRSADWTEQVLANGDFASNLLALAASLRVLASENTV